MKLFKRKNGYLPQHLRHRSWRLKATSTFSSLMLLATLIPVSALATLAEVATHANPAAAATGDINAVAIAGTHTDGAVMATAAITTDHFGNVYFVYGNVVQKITASNGKVTTVAGTETAAGYSGDGGPATSATLSHPDGVAVDSHGNLFIADVGADVVRRVDASTGIITTYAGNSYVGYSGDGGPATQAQLGWPSALVVDSSGNLYIADYWEASIRKVAPDGTISTFAGNGDRNSSVVNGDPATSGGVAPTALAIGPDGDVYFTDGTKGANDAIWKVSPTNGILVKVGGNGTAGFSGDGGPALDAEFGQYNDTDDFTMNGLAVDQSGNVYVSDTPNHRIRKINASTGDVNTIVGTRFATYFGDAGPAADAELRDNEGVALDPTGNLFIYDNGNELIRQVSATNAAPIAPPPVFPTETLGGSNPSEDVQTCNMTATPVNCSTGDFWHTFDDISIPGRGVPLSLSRTYNSLSAGNDSAFGHGWSWNYGSSVNFDAGTGTAVVTQEDGSQVSFYDNGTGTFTPPPHVEAKLVKNSDGSWTFTRRAMQIFDFDASGRLTAEKDLNGYTTSISYPNSSHVVVTDPAGRLLTFTLDNSGHVTGVTDPIGRTESFTYDSSGNLTDAIDVGGGHWQFTYDSNHYLLTMRSPRFYGDTSTTPSPVVTNVYDTNGRVTSQSDQLGRTTTFAYDDVNSTTTVTNPKGNVTFEQYANGQLVSLIKGYGTSSAATTTYTYDPASAAVATVTDSNGHTTSYTYDANGNQTGQTDALGHSTSATYSSLNDLTSATDANGNVTHYTYDSNGNIQTKTQVLNTGSGSENETTTYTYGDGSHPGDVTKVTDPMGHSTTYTYDSYGDVITATDADGNKTTYNYNGPVSIGWVMSQVSPKGNVPGANTAQYTTTYTRDNYGRVLTTKDPDWVSSNPAAHIATNVYDADGNLTSSTDGSENTTTYAYDAAGERTKTTNPNGTTQQASYYGDGSIHTQTDGNGHTTTYAYDPRGDVSSVTDPLSRATNYVYDGSGNVINEINPGGSCSGTVSGCTTYSYDADNRATGITYSDGTHSVSYQYDNDGNKIQMTDGTGSSYWSYDSLGRLTSQSEGSGATVTYGYNKDSQVSSITYPGSLTVNRTYDNAGNMTSVKDWLGNTDRFTHDPDSNQTSTKYGNDITDVSSFDNADQLTNINIGKGLAIFNYTRNGNGSLTGTTATGVTPTTESFGYDQNNQLNNYNGQNLTYDNAGNLTTTDSGSTVSYDNADEITGVTSGGTTTSFGYNTQGDRVSAGSASYSYNQIDQMTAYINGATSATYQYDGTGQRTSKTVNGNTNAFVYDNAEGTSQILSDGTNDYIYGPGGIPLEQINGSTVTYLHRDQLGSTRVLTDQNKNVVGTYSYDAYGNTTSKTGAASTPLEFAGQYKDTESGLYWLRARYYDPSTGSFTSVDPLASATKAIYKYAGNSPSNATDPTGQKTYWSFSVECVTGDVSAVSGAVSAVTSYAAPFVPGAAEASFATGVVSVLSDAVGCAYSAAHGGKCDWFGLAVDIAALVPGFESIKFDSAAKESGEILEAMEGAEHLDPSIANNHTFQVVMTNVFGGSAADLSALGIYINVNEKGESPENDESSEYGSGYPYSSSLCI
jgi:RHS repeat-associated protein